MNRFVVWLFVCLAFLGVSPFAFADVSSGRAVLRSGSGERVELVYTPDGDLLTGEFFIRNEGSAPLEVSRLAIHTTPNDPRTPPGLSVDLDKPRGGSASANVLIQPGEERRAVVRWRFAGARAKSLFAHVLVETSGRGAGVSEPGRPLVMPVHAERLNGLGFLSARALSVVVFLPLLGAFFALLLRLVGRARARWLGASSVAVQLLGLVVVVLMGLRFDSLFTAADGQDGYQFVERAVLSAPLGVEYFLGVDGVSIVLLAATSFVALIASIASFSLHERAFSYHLLAPFVLTSALGVVVSLDAFVLVAFFALGVLPLALLVARKGNQAARRAGARLLWASLISTFLLGFGVWFLWKNADAAYLVMGQAAPRSSLIPELGRVAWVGKGLSFFGWNGLKVAWSCLFFAFALRLSVFPFPGFATDVYAESDTPTSVLFAGVSFSTAVLGLFRFNVGVLPDAMRWAAPGVAVLGVVALFVSAFASIAEVETRRFAGRVLTAQAGFVLVGLGSLSPEGFQAAVAVGVAQGLVAALFFVVLGASGARDKERDLGRLASLLADRPALRLLLGLCMLALAGLPLLVGFWGPLLALVGSFGRYPVLTFVAALSVLALAGAQLFALGPVLFGERDATLGRSVLTTLDRPTLAAALPLVVMVVALGLLPRLFLGFSDGRCLELHRLVDPPGPSQIS